MACTESLSTSAPDQLWRRLYPFKSHWLAVAGQRYHYVDEGQGPPLLFVHGNPTWSFHWRNLIERWRGSYRTVAPDHLGCGLSEMGGGPYRLDDRIEHLATLVRELDLSNITLVAQDWGGAIGLGAALAEPQRFARIVLFNTGAFRPWFIPWRIRVCRAPLLGQLGLQGLNLFSRAALRMTLNRRRLAPDEQAGYLAPYDRWSHRAAVYQFVQDIPLRASHPSYARLEQIERELPALRDKPLLLVWGMRDWCFTPACLDKFIEIFPAADVLRIADAGHWVVEDAPEQTAERVEQFFDAHPLRAERGAAP